VGRAFIAIRDADIAAETMGVNLMYYKTLAFAVSAFYTGLAGGLYAFVLRFIEPELFGLLMSILFLAMVSWEAWDLFSVLSRERASCRGWTWNSAIF